ncbi:MAG: permease [Planctomycetes bacterium]|nr:permease [Planctomycetota bacterium]
MTNRSVEDIVHGTAHQDPKGSEFGLGLRASFLIMALVLLVTFHGDPGLITFALVFVSIVLEAFPFVLLGSMISGTVEVFLSKDRLADWLPRDKVVLTLIAAGAGAVFPVCECAVVPVVRRFLRKGVPLSAALAYLLAGPIFNPLVGISTWVAYSSSPLWQSLSIVGIRLFSGFGIAFAIALIMGRIFPGHAALLDQVDEPAESSGCCNRSAIHGHDTVPEKRRFILAVNHGVEDFLDVGQYLVLGAFVAGLLQTLVSRQVFLNLADVPLLAMPLMMLMAFVLSLCSEADAFLVASFRGALPLSAQMAFLVLGPMLDLKLICMYLTVFKKRTIVVLSLLILLLVFLLMTLLHGVLGSWYGQAAFGGGVGS